MVGALRRGEADSIRVEVIDFAIFMVRPAVSLFILILGGALRRKGRRIEAIDGAAESWKRLKQLKNCLLQIQLGSVRW
jgi:hypothetical protein